ncbi:MAG TPA: transcriptional regulator [Nitrospirae bacterium]|nr:transcriptional regulator [Nitrospirota bacterium]
MEAPSPDCPLSPCIKLLAGAWTLEIIWHIKNSPKRYGQLRRLLGKISSKVLTTRLRQLQERGVVFRKVIPSVPPMVEYGLTDNGKQLIPVLNAISKVKIDTDPIQGRRKDG